MLSVPVGYALLLGGLDGRWAAGQCRLAVVQQMVAQVQSFPLIAIPFFMLTGT